MCGHSGLHCHTFQPRINLHCRFHSRQSEIARSRNPMIFPSICTFDLHQSRVTRVSEGGFQLSAPIEAGARMTARNEIASHGLQTFVL